MDGLKIPQDRKQARIGARAKAVPLTETETPVLRAIITLQTSREERERLTPIRFMIDDSGRGPLAGIPFAYDRAIDAGPATASKRENTGNCAWKWEC